MDRFFSTLASGFDAISFGSVITLGAGKVCDFIATLITTTITNGVKVRMDPRKKKTDKRIQSLAASWCVELFAGPDYANS
jgi:hypothetical protein